MIKRSQQKPTITAGAYSAGDAVGGLLTFDLSLNNFNEATIFTASLVDLGKQSVTINLILFTQTFAATANNAPFDPVDADMDNYLGSIQFAAGNYTAFNDSSACSVLAIGLAYYSTDPLGRIYGQLHLPVGSAPTYTSTQDLIVTLYALQERG